MADPRSPPTTTWGSGSLPGAARRARRAGLAGLGQGSPAHRSALGLAAVLLTFGVSAVVVPTLAPMPINDDFAYARSVRTLIEDGTVQLLPTSVSTIVGQVVWGAAWSTVFGDSYGSLRAATVLVWALGGALVWALGGAATFGLGRQVGLRPGLATLGAALVVFNPLGYVLGFTFMSDPYLTSLGAAATWAYARGLAGEQESASWTIAASALAAVAFLVRHAGIMVPLAVLGWLAFRNRQAEVPSSDVDGQVTGRSAPMGTAARVALVPGVTVVAYLAWLWWVHGTGEHLDYITGHVSDATADGSLVTLIHRLIAIETFYIGGFVLPVSVLVAPHLPRIVRRMPAPGRVVGLAALALLASTAGHFSPFQPRDPWAPQFLGRTGLGPLDWRGGRPELIAPALVIVLLVLWGASALIAGAALCRRFALQSGPEERAAGLVLAVLAGQALAVAAPSVTLRHSVITYDRYMLPLLPLAVVAALWAAQPWIRRPAAAWAVVGVAGIFAVVATRDSLEVQHAVWATAGRAVDHGDAAPLELDGGAAWVGDHIYHRPVAESAPDSLYARDPQGSLTDVEPWWIGFYGPEVTGDLVVSTTQLDGYEVIDSTPVDQWLSPPTEVLVLRRGPSR